MVKLERYSFQLFDMMVKVLPLKIRKKFVTKNSILKLLINNGGIRCTNDLVRKSGFEGKWTESVETIPFEEEKLVTGLMGSLRVMKQQQDNFPSAYIPAHEWRCLLEDQWKQPLKYIHENDLVNMSCFLRNFFRNEAISGFWGECSMFEQFQSNNTAWGLTREYLMYLDMEVLNEYLHDWNIDDLDAPRVGNPWGYKVHGRLLYEPVFSYYLQAEYINRLIGSAGHPVVLEIGGGFGGLASHLLKCNSNLKYIGLDLPENVVIQSYYLSCVYPKLRVYVYDESFNLLDMEMLKSYDVVLLPNYCLPLIDVGVVDMLVNVRSLSEMSEVTIKEYFEQVDRIKPEYFFHENICKERGDGLHGIPSNRFPVLKNYNLVYSGPSRWVNYGVDSIYPCHENLFRLVS